MTKKRAALIALIFEAVSLVALFLPGVYAQEYWKADEDWGWGIFTKLRVEAVNFLPSTTEGPGLSAYLTLLALAAAVIVLALFLGGRIGSGQKGSRLTALPALAFVLLLVTAVLRIFSDVDNGTNGYWRYGFGWLLYPVLALALAAAVLSVLLASGKFRDAAPAAAAPAADAAD